MRFKLIITAQRGNSIPINYQYPLSAAIYKILATGDAQYAEWLHQEGYAADSYNFKLFSYSRLRGTQGIENNALAVSSEPLELILSFLATPGHGEVYQGFVCQQRNLHWQSGDGHSIHSQGDRTVALTNLYR